MSQTKVEAYSLGFNVVEKQAFLHYWLKGEDTAHALTVSGTELTALADMLRNEGSVVYDEDRESFVTAREQVGHGGNQPHPKYP